MRQSIKIGATRQRGAALVVSLILLVLVSLLAAGGFLATTGEARGAANWSDRQRALYLAESVLQEGWAAVGGVTAANVANLEPLLRAKPTGYFIRGKTGFSMFPWNEDTFNANSIEVKNVAGVSGTVGRYVVFFEGMVAESNDGTGLVSSNGSNVKAAQHARFTVYAKAGGQRDGTLVVLSASKQF